MSGRYGLEIRTATEADAPGLAELLRAAGRAVAPRALAQRIGAVQNAGGTVLIALDWGPPSGLVVLHGYPALEADLPFAQITTLLVGPDDRRRGIGRLLLKAAAQAARVAGCGTLRVSAAPDQEDLAEFCRAAGFAEADAGFVRPLRKKAQEA
ncbi:MULTISPECIES: GNAT family N-acetyltransferase [Methylobacterium]|uniref:N-acetyltransferase domain-containing protein n=1 Tax=Methylobacterium thuringiense TaxID=1003091 RepID=A0ABQ4TSM6_9HYPH|nr:MULTISPECIES: GNAT family N-acetyltransferase [Methylobacterium]TXN19770.1 GNAT family N-acetyltransferase [Methylobacterium sp. WL9]GJE57409.1 hypothetical protein EKPJFOCH_3924 [Methylobacterium thuringiense]